MDKNLLTTESVDTDFVLDKESKKHYLISFLNFIVLTDPFNENLTVKFIFCTHQAGALLLFHLLDRSFETMTQVADGLYI